MGWIKVDTNFGRHPKFLAIDQSIKAQAIALYVGGLAYCAEYLTDGVIPTQALSVIARDHGVIESERVSKVLVIVKLWRRQSYGYRVDGYLDHQSGKEKVRDKQEKQREAARRYRVRKKDNVMESSSMTEMTRHAPRSRREVEEKRREETSTSQRAKDTLWECLVAELGEPATRSERGRINSALKELRQIGATVEDVEQRIAEYRRRWPDIDITPQAIVGNWTLLEPQPSSVLSLEQFLALGGDDDAAASTSANGQAGHSLPTTEG